MATDSFGQRRQENAETRSSDSSESQRYSSEPAGRSQAAANQQTIAQTAHALLKRWEESRLKQESATSELEAPIVPAQSGDSLVYAQGTLSRRSAYSEEAETEPELDFSASLDTDLSSDTELLEELQRYSPLREAQRAPLRTASPLKADETTLMPAQPELKVQPDLDETRQEIPQYREKTAFSAPPSAPSSLPKSVSTTQSSTTQKEEDIFRNVTRTGFTESESLQTAALRQSLKDLSIQKPLEKQGREQAVQARPAGSPPFSASANSGLLKRDVQFDSKEEKLMSERISVPDSISEQTSVRQSPVSVKESFTERLAKREQKESIETESSQKPSAGQVQFSSATQRLEEFENEQNVQPLQLSQKSNRSTGKQRNWSALLGQFLAFSGALAMTGGAAVVIGNRFGSLEIAETTGWLALAGGHLLFVLGLYTHLTSRVEQTWNDLHARTDEIGRLIQQQQNAQKAFYQESARLNQSTDSRSVNRG